MASSYSHGRCLLHNHSHHHHCPHCLLRRHCHHCPLHNNPLLNLNPNPNLPITSPHHAHKLSSDAFGGIRSSQEPEEHIELDGDKEDDEPVFVLTDEWREFFAKSQAKRKLEKKQAKKGKK